jgi:putative transposase
VPVPAHSPNCTPHAERFVRTVRSECLDQFVIFGERPLRYLLDAFCAHHHGERLHPGLGSRLIRPSASPGNDNAKTGGIQRRSRLGGLLNYYHREAA